MAIQFELLILPCIISITVALTWITFLVKDASSTISKSLINVAFVVAWVSVALFIVSLYSVIENMYIEAPTKSWAGTFILGWTLFFVSTSVFYFGYIMKK